MKDGVNATPLPTVNTTGYIDHAAFLGTINSDTNKIPKHLFQGYLNIYNNYFKAPWMPDRTEANFFFQAEDGIRYWSVTGVQTCALPIYCAEEHDRHHREQDHRAERQLRLPVRGRRQDHVAEPLVRAHELPDDGADHRERDGHLGAGEEERHRHRQPDFEKRLERAGAVRAAQVEQLRRRRGEACRGVDDDGEEGDKEGDDHLGDLAVAQHQQQHRRDGDFRDGLREHDQRVQRVLQRRRIDDEHGQRHADDDGEREAAQGLVEGHPRVAEKAVAPVPALGEDGGRCRHDEAGNAEGVRGRFPGDEHADERRDRHEIVAHDAPANHRVAARRAKIRLRTSSLAALNRGSNSDSIVRGRGRPISRMRAMRPGRAVMTTTRSASRMASGMLWVTKRIVLRRSSQTRSSSRLISSRVMASSAPKGSSIRSRLGSGSRARQIATRCCMPPDSSRGYFVSKPPSPVSSSRSPACLRYWRGSSPSISTEKSTLSSTERHGSSTGCWKTKPTSVNGSLTAVSRTRIAPRVAGVSPATSLSSVLLPQPLGPTSVTNSFSSTWSVTSSTARTRSPRRVR